MPYDKPRQTALGWVLPKKAGGYHRSNGKVAHFKTKEDAEQVAKYIINAIDRGKK
jgi:hypothetical protein